MTEKKPWALFSLVVLLVIAIGINYIDRGSLSVVKTDVAAEFNLDAIEMGKLFSAFFWSYALFQIAAGWCVDRYDVKWVYAIGFLIWSLATALTGFATGFAMLLALRILLGMGESVAFPATSRVIAQNIPESQRGFINALVDAASKFGPAICIFFGGHVVVNHGWRMLFLVVGFGSLIWLPFWLWLVPSANKTEQVANKLERTNAVTIWQLLQRKEVWATSIAFFGLGYAWAFLLTWLPSYFEEVRGFKKVDVAMFGWMPFCAMAFTSMFGGSLADWFIRRGYTPTNIRKLFMSTGLLGAAVICYLAMKTTDNKTSFWLMIVGCAFLGLYTANVWAVTQTLAGPRAAGQWSGFQNAIGNIGSAISPWLTGVIIQETKSYDLAFAASSGMLFAAIFIYLFFIGAVAPLQWNLETKSDDSSQ